jgi:hypothetical protein
VGYSSYGDIIIDNSETDGPSDCRIEVFSGEYVGAVARFDSELNLQQASTYSFWGAKAACLIPISDTNIVIVLEACCSHYFDNYFPPDDW